MSAHYSVTNNMDDDFERKLVTFIAEDGDQKVVWKLPERIMARGEIFQLIYDEITNELHERLTR